MDLLENIRVIVNGTKGHPTKEDGCIQTKHPRTKHPSRVSEASALPMRAQTWKECWTGSYLQQSD